MTTIVEFLTVAERARIAVRWGSAEKEHLEPVVLVLGLDEWAEMEATVTTKPPTYLGVPVHVSGHISGVGALVLVKQPEGAERGLDAALFKLVMV